LAIAVIAIVAVFVHAESPIAIHQYNDAFCSTVTSTKEFNAGVCTANGDNFIKYAIEDGVLSHCTYGNKECEGTAIQCGQDTIETGRCIQTGQGVSIKAIYQKVVNDAAVVGASNDWISAAVSSSSGGSAAPSIDYVYAYRYVNTSYACGTSSRYAYQDKTFEYRVGRCMSPSQTPRGQYYELVTMYGSQDTTSSTYGYVCSYTNSDCRTGSQGCVRFSYNDCFSISSYSSYRWSWGWEELLKALATIIIVIIVIASLCVVGGILACCCCGAAAAACFGRCFCGMCGPRQSSTEYHVRLAQ
jgi:hypothetical protein